MENFRIDFTMSNPFPDGKKIGECGEKNAAQLIITPPENLASREEIRSYVVAFSTGRGPVRFGPVPKAETITVPVGNALTVGSALSVQVEGYDSDGEFIIKSPVLSGILISSSIADGDCSDGEDKNVIPGHSHENLEILDSLSDKNGVLLYNGKEISVTDNQEIKEVILDSSSFIILTGEPFFGNMNFVVLNDENGNPYVPEGAKILSVEFKSFSHEHDEWFNIKDMIKTENHIPYAIGQFDAFYSENYSGTIITTVTFLSENTNSYYYAAENFLIDSLRVRYTDAGGEA